MSSAKITVDVSELNELAVDLAKAPIRVQLRAAKSVAVGSRKTRDRARDFAPSGPHLPVYAASITFDVTTGRDYVEGETGPDKDLPQGPLGNILEYGTSRTAPQAHLGPAHDLEVPEFLVAIGEDAEEAVFG